MPTLDLKIPPPIVAVLAASAMWAVSKFDGSHDWAELWPTFRIGTALMIATVGAGFDVAGIIAFRHAKTTLNPMKPGTSVALVSSGIYRITRNPMYVGMGLILLAWAVYLASSWALWGPLAFATYITRYQIKPEERALTARFGNQFASYQTSVQRWL